MASQEELFLGGVEQSERDLRLPAVGLVVETQLAGPVHVILAEGPERLTGIRFLGLQNGSLGHRRDLHSSWRADAGLRTTRYAKSRDGPNVSYRLVVSAAEG